VAGDAAAATSPGTQGEGYRLQVAAVRTPAEAQRIIHLLRGKGYEPIVAQSVDTKPIWYRVVLGPFPSIHSAQEVGARINKTLRFSPIVINQPHP
jgi:cell division septation protein DedD